MAKKARPVDKDERAFNETLQRMLKTPPKPHEKSAKTAPKIKAEKKKAKWPGID